MSSVCIIAEIGTSHQGDLVKAKELIAAAAESGADTAKFQWVYADEIIHPKTGLVSLPTGKIPLYERFRSLEQGPDFFGALKEYCESQGLEFLCTPFGLKSARQLLELGVSRFKIASPELNHLPLIEFLALSGRPLLVSSGVSRLSDIEEALDTIRDARRGSLTYLPLVDPSAIDAARKAANSPQKEAEPEITLLHCMTAYPSPEDEYNLRLVENLRSIFGVATGISDHSMDPALIPVISTLLGGTTIEKHFTMSNNTDGLDDPIALDPTAFARKSRVVRTVEKSSGTDDGKLSVSNIAEILRGAGIEITEEYLGSILGNGVKSLAATEKENYGKTNRSIHALGDLKPGDTLEMGRLCIVRSEKILRPGLHPRFLPIILGRHISRPVPDGEGILWEDLA